VIELHTGAWCDSLRITKASVWPPGELVRIKGSAVLASGQGLECHAGHGSICPPRSSRACRTSCENSIPGPCFLIDEAVFHRALRRLGQDAGGDGRGGRRRMSLVSPRSQIGAPSYFVLRLGALADCRFGLSEQASAGAL